MIKLNSCQKRDRGTQCLEGYGGFSLSCQFQGKQSISFQGTSPVTMLSVTHIEASPPWSELDSCHFLSQNSKLQGRADGRREHVHMAYSQNSHISGENLVLWPHLITCNHRLKHSVQLEGCGQSMLTYKKGGVSFGRHLTVISFHSSFQTSQSSITVNQMSQSRCSKQEGPFNKVFSQIKISNSDSCLVVFITPLCEIACSQSIRRLPPAQFPFGQYRRAMLFMHRQVWGTDRPDFG